MQATRTWPCPPGATPTTGSCRYGCRCSRPQLTRACATGDVLPQQRPCPVPAQYASASNTPPCHGRDGGSVQRNHCVLARMQHAHPRLLQEFAWAEEDIPKRRADRGSSLKADVAAELAKQPMFCFEVGPTMSVPLDDSRAQPAIHRLMHSPSVHADFMCTFADLAEDAVLEHAHLSTRGGTDALLHLRCSRPLRFLQKPRVSIRCCLYASELPIEATHSRQHASCKLLQRQASQVLLP